MNYKMMGRFNASIIAIEGAFMLPAMLISFLSGEAWSGWSFLISIGICALVSVILYILTRGAEKDFYAKEGLLCVGISWIMLSLFGALPFIISGEIPDFVDALFEIVSGFTTTGASILRDVEAMSRGMLYWRSFSHWLGGMGVLVFLLAIVPVSGRSEGYTMHLLRAESPGPEVGKLVPKMRHTAAILYTTYIVLTIVNFIFLVFDMPVFDAVCTAFGTAGTGGFGIKAKSMADYSPYVQNVTTIFMALFGVNFSCYYFMLIGNFKSALKNEELRLYLGIIAVSTLAIAFNILSMYGGFGEALRHAAFQVSSIITTTGFSTTDFDLWPALSKAIIVFLMICGACAGSTGGGFKCVRILLVLKMMRRNLFRMLHPHRVRAVHLNGEPVDEKTLDGTNAYLATYVTMVVGSMMLLAVDTVISGEQSLLTIITSVLSCFNNIGPGLDAVGPVRSYADLGVLSKLVLTFDMLAGRLEIFPIIVLFYPTTWKKV